MNTVRVVAPLLFLADVVALGTVGLMVRVRTRGMRGGRVPEVRLGPGAWRTSPTTHLAWVGGAAAGLWAVALGGPTAFVLGPAAGFVAATGLALRVTRLEVRADALRVHYAARAARHLEWNRCRALRPPAGPLGAWRIEAGDVAASLMPSDLLGNEPVLAEVARRAGLSFDRGTWERPEPSRVSRRR